MGKGTERLQDVDATVRLQRPAEPPVGTFSQVDRTDRLFYRFPTPSPTSYSISPTQVIGPLGWTSPNGDTMRLRFPID